MDDLLKTIGMDDRTKLAMQAEKYVDILLKYFQIMYYADQLDKHDLAEEVSKKFVPLIQVLVDNMDEMTQKYQKEHGEI